MTDMHRSKTLIMALVFGLATSVGYGCGSDNNNDKDPVTNPGEFVKSEKQRITDPLVAPTILDQLSSSNTGFAFDLHQVLPRDVNSFYSPISISLALAMTYAGAKGNTATEMAQALHYDLPQAELHPAFNSLDLALASRGQGAQGKDGGKFRLNVINEIWGQEGVFLEPDFLDTLALNYGAGLRLMDFENQPEDCRLIINEWVEDQTEDRIKELLEKGDIDSNTWLVLTNAIYFNAAWAKNFNKNQTRAEPFTLNDGSTVEVQMMNKVRQMTYAKGADWEVVDMPYDGGELSMLLVLPAAGKLAQIEATLTGGDVEKMVDQLQVHEVTLAMPRFKVESKFELKDALKQLGMIDAFTGAADFSGINGGGLFIGKVIHQSFVEVDEEGTEAAAATAVIMPPIGMPPEDPKVTVRLDRPFLFLIRDRATGAVLFVGRIVDPTA